MVASPSERRPIQPVAELAATFLERYIGEQHPQMGGSSSCEQAAKLAAAAAVDSAMRYVVRQPPAKAKALSIQVGRIRKPERIR